MTEDGPVYVTEGLLAVLLELAADADPDPLTVSLVATPAGEWAPLDPATPVFSDFYLPDAGRSIRGVFGMDLSTPPGRGRFLSHPDGRREITRRDDLAARVLVAVPPWDPADVAAYDRHGTRLPLERVAAAPPQRPLD